MTQETAGRPSLDDPSLNARPFTLRYGGPGKAEVLLDGQDVTKHVSGVRIDAVAPDPVAYVVLELNPHAEGVLFDGLARVAVGETPDPGPAAAVFLSAIDPEQLERAALQRLDIDQGEGGLTGAMLRQLTEWASGRS